MSKVTLRSKNKLRPAGFLNQLQVHKSFLSPHLAKELRKEFLSVFSDPRFSHPKRFIWDHWHIADQYRLHRTPAQDFFSAKNYQVLCNALVRFGQDFLGCHTISQPWLSYYVDGDFQSIHTDSPHGPWAYVFSLTEWNKRKFSGGETLILKPETLNYWRNYSRARGLEKENIFTKIPAQMNQLTIFDPRLPHAVEPVRGTFEPIEGRLVVHGWFVQPEPFVTGGLKKARLKNIVNSINKQLQLTSYFSAEHLVGTLIVRFYIQKNGSIRASQILTNHLINTQTNQLDTLCAKELLKASKRLQLPTASSDSELTLPLIFD